MIEKMEFSSTFDDGVFKKCYKIILKDIKEISIKKSINKMNMLGCRVV